VIGFRLFPCLALTVVAAAAQNAATLEGTVRDAQGHPLAAATVSLQPKPAGISVTGHTDPAGRYRFTGLAAGAYLLSAQSGGSGEAAAPPVSIAAGELKKVDLTVEYAFIDEPHFMVAGVTDPSGRGGHGSDTVLRSTEALAQATASLNGESHGAGYASELQGNALAAQREYRRAAELDPCEPNLFNWGSELLMHGASEPATEVFAKAHRLFPQSARVLLGMAAAWYARGDFGQAARFFFEACDLNPSDPVPYMFLGKVQSIEIVSLPEYAQRLARFAQLHPGSPWANYYYAAALSKQSKGPDDSSAPARARELLEKAVALDPGMGVAYLQLGIVYSSQNDDPKAIAAYRKAIEASPALDEPHYRLGQAYARTGQKEKARQELDIYQQMSRTLLQERERERRAIQQFVFELR